MAHKKTEGKIALAAALLCACCFWIPAHGRGEAAVLTAYAGETTAPDPNQPVEINDAAELRQWYESQTGTDNRIGIISKELVINNEVILSVTPDASGNAGIHTSQNRHAASGASQNHNTASGQNRNAASGTSQNLNAGAGQEAGRGLIQLMIQRNENGAKGMIRIKGNGSLIINDPNLLITGPDNLISVEDYGSLKLDQGRMELENKEPDIPAIVCRDRSRVMVSDTYNNRKPLVIGLLPSPDGNIPQPDTGQDSEPYLTEALLMNIKANRSGLARLRFQNLPADITALYIYRSGDGKSWTKEKKQVETAAAQGGQGTVEYENFLKEPGNILDRGIVEDEYLMYSFPSQNSSFYVKARIEWPDGEAETPMIKIAIPEYTGQGLTFSYGSGDYGSGYGSYGGGYGSNSGAAGSSYGNQSGSQDSPAEKESDAPEAPVRRGGGRSRNQNTPPYNTQPPAQAANPSQISSLSQIPTPNNAMAAGEGMADAKESDGEESGANIQEPFLEPKLLEDEPIDMESGLAGQPDMQHAGGDEKMQYAAAAALILAVGAAGFFLCRKWKKQKR